mgnify:CR=1 FL=1
MKFFLISDNVDTKMGMRFAGIEGVVVHQEDEVRSELEKAVNRDDIAVILITETLVSLCPDLIYDLKLNRKQPLIVEIPDRHGNGRTKDSITKYVQLSRETVFSDLPEFSLQEYLSVCFLILQVCP